MPAAATIPMGPKPGGYYAQARAEVIDELPVPLGRVLDVGCAEGAAARSLRAAGATWISGIELLPEPAATAAGRYDEVQVGERRDPSDRVQARFDTVRCYDVLERLVDPEARLRRARRLSPPGARLHVSGPNARHCSLLRDLALRGTFGYAEWGHRDATHLRWFTRRDIVELVRGAGWTPVATTPSALHRVRELRLPAPERLVRGLGGEFLAVQWYVLARAASPE